MKQLHHSSEIGNRLKEIRFDRLAFCESTPGVVLAKPATLIVSPVYFHCPQPPPPRPANALRGKVLNALCI